MTTKSTAVSLTLTLLLAPLFLPVVSSRASAAERFFCHWTVFNTPKSPNVRYKCICPKKICPGCPIENFGYFPACWQRWPFPPYYGHCPVPPITLNAAQSTLDEPRRSDELLPPSKMPLESAPPAKMPPESIPPAKTPPEPKLP
ncbi:MAG TPA: hypothetical protein VMF69_04155 [Gemmataceae bacterium]|nr:hypothetical protein [Gemmataceae bacterium]